MEHKIGFVGSKANLFQNVYNVLLIVDGMSREKSTVFLQSAGLRFIFNLDFLFHAMGQVLAVIPVLEIFLVKVYAE